MLKILENIIGNRIEPVIKKNSASLQGGGTKGESPEEYIFVVQTVIDNNKQKQKTTKSNNKEIFHALPLNIVIYSLEVCNIHRGAAEVNITLRE